MQITLFCVLKSAMKWNAHTICNKIMFCFSLPLFSGILIRTSNNTSFVNNLYVLCKEQTTDWFIFFKIDHRLVLCIKIRETEIDLSIELCNSIQTQNYFFFCSKSKPFFYVRFFSNFSLSITDLCLQNKLNNLL